MLGFFKYGNFLLENFKWLVAQIGITYQPPHLDLFDYTPELVKRTDRVPPPVLATRRLAWAGASSTSPTPTATSSASPDRYEVPSPESQVPSR